ncbi:TPA: hypothetical protein HA361_02135 [Candidatus Woesearchaeota archaeon]|nr:hypothetical protein [Candidatus Woesearchaeota archaeon]HII68440.1 hypothetical protein [Candidatus Woesearchaeota archaeon]
MLAPFIVWLAVIIIAGLIFLKLGMKAAKAILSLIGVAMVAGLLIGGVYAYLLYKDVMDYKENFPDEQKLLVLEDDGEVLTAIALHDVEDDETVETLARSEIEEEKIGSWKTFTIEKEYFGDIGAIEVDGKGIRADDIIEAIDTGDISTVDITLPEGENQASLLFMLLIAAKARDDPLFLFNGVRQGYITVEPQSLLFTTIGIIPKGITDSLINQTLDSKRGEHGP